MSNVIAWCLVIRLVVSKVGKDITLVHTTLTASAKTREHEQIHSLPLFDFFTVSKCSQLPFFPLAHQQLPFLLLYLHLHLADSNQSNLQQVQGHSPEASRVKCLAQGHNVIFCTAGNRTGNLLITSPIPSPLSHLTPLLDYLQHPRSFYRVNYDSSFKEEVNGWSHLILHCCLTIFVP